MLRNSRSSGGSYRARKRVGWRFGGVPGGCASQPRSEDGIVAAGLDIETLCDVDSSEPGWVARISSAALIVTDVVSARELPVGVPIHVFRVIADSSVAELEELFVR